jgi:hypothetical protein
LLVCSAAISDLAIFDRHTIGYTSSSRCRKPWQTRFSSVCKLFAGQDCCWFARFVVLMRRWWSQTGSNRRPHACKARALPTELWPRAARRFRMHSHLDVVGLGRLELPTSRLSSARSNQLSYKPELMTPPGEDCESPRARAGLSGKKEKRRRRRSRMIGLTGHCSEEIR